MAKKKFKLLIDLYGPQGNAYCVLGMFTHEARRNGWTEEEIEEVLTEAKSSDYTNLIDTLNKHLKAPKMEIPEGA